VTSDGIRGNPDGLRAAAPVPRGVVGLALREAASPNIRPFVARITTMISKKHKNAPAIPLAPSYAVRCRQVLLDRCYRARSSLPVTRYARSFGAVR